MTYNKYFYVSKYYNNSLLKNIKLKMYVIIKKKRKKY